MTSIDPIDPIDVQPLSEEAYGQTNIDRVEAIHYRQKWEHERDRRYTELAIERDRRYAEVNIERERAMRIKDEADKEALRLSRESQIYKDEKANELREQINRERGLYASKEDVIAAVGKIEVTIKPIAEYIASDRGQNRGFGISWTVMISIFTIALLAGALVDKVFLH